MNLLLLWNRLYFEEWWGPDKIGPHWLSLYGHFNIEKSTNNILKMAGSGRQLNWTTVILYSMKVTKEHAFHHPFSGLGYQHPLKASRNNGMLESTNSSLFSEGQDTNCIFTIINTTESFPVCGSSLVYLCISLLCVELKTAFSCDFI